MPRHAATLLERLWLAHCIEYVATPCLSVQAEQSLGDNSSGHGVMVRVWSAKRMSDECQFLTLKGILAMAWDGGRVRRKKRAILRNEPIL